MPDWREIVSKGLSGLKLGADEKEEVRAELAEHLEETYKALRARGIPEQAAIQQTLAQVAEDRKSGVKVKRARKGRETMIERMKKLWLPGILAFSLSTGRLELI